MSLAVIYPSFASAVADFADFADFADSVDFAAAVSVVVAVAVSVFGLVPDLIDDLMSLALLTGAVVLYSLDRLYTTII